MFQPIQYNRHVALFLMLGGTDFSKYLYKQKKIKIIKPNSLLKIITPTGGGLFICTVV